MERSDVTPKKPDKGNIKALSLWQTSLRTKKGKVGFVQYFVKGLI